jgi:uncharacterized protein YjbI with pentapeptide repeats
VTRERRPEWLNRLRTRRRGDDLSADANAPRDAAANTERLLDAANSASQHVAALHIAFLALCAYVLVIVFSTTDRDLLLGKGVKLPVIDVEVPIAGFYTVAPYLVVLVHFNLLLQLQLLSRKLYAFDDAAPADRAIGGPRDRLHIFPYTYYLVGHATAAVNRLISIMVTITVLLLPVVTLLALQFRFLAFQSVYVTWAQRLAAWLDVLVVFILWPVIISRTDSWTAYFRSAIAKLQRHWVATLPGLVLIATWITACLTTDVKVFLVSVALAALTTIFFGVIHVARSFFHFESDDQQGLRALILTAAIGLPLPLALVARGEALERLFETRLYPGAPVWLRNPLIPAEDLRRLVVPEAIILARAPKPELIADLRSDDPAQAAAAARALEPANLKGRSLRDAYLARAVLTGADLRGAQLQGAWLDGAQLYGADLVRADLEYARLRNARLPKARLTGAHMPSADLGGADLTAADLGAADLREVNLSGANLADARLQGADLRYARLDRAVLNRANLLGADLRGATLAIADAREALIQFADVRKADLAQFKARGAKLGACLVDRSEDPCEIRYEARDLDRFRTVLGNALASVVCEDPSGELAYGLLNQICNLYEPGCKFPAKVKDEASGSTRLGLAALLLSATNYFECLGSPPIVSDFSEAEFWERERRGQKP